MKFRVWFITGASRGFGLEIAKAVLEQGGAVVAAARKPDECRERLKSLGDVLAVRLDVNDRASVESAVAQAVKHFGKVDVLVNNAGFGLLGAMEELESNELEDVFKTNVFGVHTVTRAMLPILRAQRSGYVVNISSAGGFTASPGWGAYNSSKFALEGMSESLSQELAPLGIKVMIVEPGYFRTDFLNDSMKSAAKTISDYHQTAGKMRETADARNGKQPGDPRKAALAILKAVESPEPPLRLCLGVDSFDRIGNKLTAVRSELDKWRDVSVNTDFDADKV
jgi:NAD(P)-dependent dehydrogenase (short-subunit alcohol dehydrogenase family)